MPWKNGDPRHAQIGGRHRAEARYAMLLNRTKNTHRSKNKNYAGVEVRVSKEEFVEWFMPRDFLGASVDRIDTTGHYELANMQVVSLAENIRKDKTKCPGDTCTCFACGEEKPLEEFVKDKRRANGRGTSCKACDNLRRRGP